MKKFIGYLFIIFLLTSPLSGCEVKTKYEFIHDSPDISSIEIVKVGEESSQEIIEQTTISIVDDMERFIEDFNRINCYTIYSDPSGIEDNAVVIKIIYNNDDYELIGVGGQAKYVSGKYDNYVGYQYFDQDQYKALISKYSDNNIG